MVHPSGNARYNLIADNFKVLELSLAPLGYRMLIGRDILSQCHFVYDGARQSFWLNY